MKISGQKPLFSLLLLVSALAYLALGYSVPRENFLALTTLFGLLFSIYFYLLRSEISLKTGLTFAFVFRLLLLFSVPALSDDYFRFLWDGRLISAVQNPFLHLPDFYAGNNFQNIPGLNTALYQSLNSPHYFSVYPPVCQFIFALPAFIDPGNNLLGIILMRGFILLAEAGTIWLLLKLIKTVGLEARKVLWYALNPLVIMELTGNLHFEALMIFFSLLAFYFFHQKRYPFSAVALGFAVCSKLLPLIVLPFLFKRLGLKNWSLYCGITGITCLVLFLPFVNPELIAHFSNSLNLYFQKFEFNAGVYYVLREFGWYFYGYNQIANLGPLLSFATFGTVLYLAFREKEPAFSNLPKLFLLALTVHFLLATIVHPWYLTTLVALSVLANSRYAIVWSGLAILSYAAYQTNAHTENPWLLALEYGGLFTAILLEKRYAFGLKNPELSAQKNR
ncbi:hypothetical protein I5M27_05570 [Adhaeribacter sp. BT258]|uniref:DUF2029 domain-containing protein n=1 Tax=Adhaeribacter terrigena TaxID=2793070 RepID=A0ABS1BZ92_9BACT|nr:hypothetical protein [Adhaeribacter terrigena]MBK0402444.1 hypothetical protein [Adhaeribacter terrigena]